MVAARTSRRAIRVEPDPVDESCAGDDQKAEEEANDKAEQVLRKCRPPSVLSRVDIASFAMSTARGWYSTDCSKRTMYGQL